MLPIPPDVKAGVMASIFGAFLVGLFFPMYIDAATFNPAVTQDNLQQTVCAKGWVLEQRPDSWYTQKWEKDNGGGVLTVVDHKAPICAGGAPNDPDNWQLQGKKESYKKDVTERLVCRLLCEGKLTLKQAQQMFWQ